MAARLPRAFFADDVLEVAPTLLGCTLTHAGVTLRVTETEAYAGEGLDPGSHAFRGETPRTAPMFGPPGFTYVYFTYGMHWCLCFVTGAVGEAQAVLVRAGEVVAGHDVAAARRAGVAPRDWCRGPARLTSTLALDGRHHGLDVCVPAVGGGSSTRADQPSDIDGYPDLVVGPPEETVDLARVRRGPRVGVAGPGGDGTAYPWRFWLDGERSVSAYRPAKPRVRRPTA